MGRRQSLKFIFFSGGLLFSCTETSVRQSSNISVSKCVNLDPGVKNAQDIDCVPTIPTTSSGNQSVDLRILNQSDQVTLMRFAQDKAIWKMFRGTEDTYSEDWVSAIIRGSQAQMSQWPTKDPFVFAIEKDHLLVGLIGLLHMQRYGNLVSGEMWYILDPDFWRQGIMTLAAQKFLVAAFVDGIGPKNIRLKTVSAQTLTTNLASASLLERLHFTKIRSGFPNGDLKWVDYELKVEKAYVKFLRIKHILAKPCK